VGMVWPDVAGRGKAWQWLCKDPEGAVGAAARPCQVTLIWDGFSLRDIMTNLRGELSKSYPRIRHPITFSRSFSPML
jgi:hypothetical protein